MNRAVTLTISHSPNRLHEELKAPSKSLSLAEELIAGVKTIEPRTHAGLTEKQAEDLLDWFITREQKPNFYAAKRVDSYVNEHSDTTIQEAFQRLSRNQNGELETKEVCIGNSD